MSSSHFFWKIGEKRIREKRLSTILVAKTTIKFTENSSRHVTFGALQQCQVSQAEWELLSQTASLPKIKKGVLNYKGTHHVNKITGVFR